jgi:hypothetical protein
MSTFERKPKATLQTGFARSIKPNTNRFKQSAAMGEDENVELMASQAVPFDHDFSNIPIASPEQTSVLTRSANQPNMRAMVRHHKQTFSATIRGASPGAQNDSMNGEESKPTIAGETPLLKGTARPTSQSGLESEEGKGVLFPADMFETIALPGQSDTISAAFAYKNNINPVNPPANPSGFGETNPFYKFEAPGPRAVQSAGNFDVTGTILADIPYWVAGGTRTDIASDNDPDITQTNYTTVVSDLTPAPRTMKSGGLDLYKGQPPRTKFYAHDLTVKHELFHADEDVKFGQEGVNLAQTWLNSQTARDYNGVGGLLNRINPMISSHVVRKMALPGRELRAYDNGAPDYTTRAQAIKTKGDAKGYVPKPPPPKAPVTPPAPTPKPTGTATPPVIKEPEAK